MAPRGQPAPRSSYPAPRTTTRSDVRVADVRPAPTEPGLSPRGTSNPTSVRGAPAPVGGSVRPIGGSSTGGKPAAPTSRDLYDRGSSRPKGGTKNAPIATRYTPTKPVARPGVTPAPLDTTRVSARPKGPAISDRYPTRANPTATLAPSPKLVTPTAAAPRLQPRSIVSGSAGRTFSTVDSFCRPASQTWNCWWDPCHSYSSHWHSGCGWSLWGGHGCYGFGVSFWYPWYSYCNHWCYQGYSSCWWNSWSAPYCPSSSYWWYPSSTYCPTYFYVPSSVAIGEEVIVEGAAERNLPPDDLAKKYVELGDFYFKAGRFAEAEDTYARARTYAPDDASIHFVLADAAFATGDYHFAAFLIAEAVRLDPSLVSANTDKRLFYGDPKAFEEQMALLDKYLAEKPYDASGHLVRGYNLRFSEQPVLAIAAFRRVLELAPEQPAARAFLAALEPANAAEPSKG